MSEKKVVKVLLSQIEEALEERQSNERRGQSEAKIPDEVESDRRRNDRRDAEAKQGT